VTICSLIYSSRLSTDPAGIVESILGAAQRNNPPLGLTGALVFDHRSFIQLLEGGRSTVTEMFLRISRDARHSDLRIIRVADAPKRQFPEWSMHHAAMRGTGPLSVRAFMPDVEFEPAQLSSESATALFTELAVQARTLQPGAA
jgi:hypothetical protein